MVPIQTGKHQEYMSYVLLKICNGYCLYRLHWQRLTGNANYIYLRTYTACRNCNAHTIAGYSYTVAVRTQWGWKHSLDTGTVGWHLVY